MSGAMQAEDKSLRYITVIAFAYVILTLPALFFSGCSPVEQTNEISRIKDVIVRYNRGMIAAARTGDVEPLKGLASEAVVRKLYFWIAAWQDSNSYMDAVLKDIKVTSVVIKGTTAKALSAEEWYYEYRSLKDRSTVSPASGMYYEMEYTLQKNERAWTISDIRILSQKRQEIK